MGFLYMYNKNRYPHKIHINRKGFSMDETTTTSEDGLSLEQSIALQQFKSYLKRRSINKNVKEAYRNEGCKKMAVDCLTSQGTVEPIAFDFWYAHWSSKYAKLIKSQENMKWAHYGLKNYILKRYYDERNNK